MEETQEFLSVGITYYMCDLICEMVETWKLLYEYPFKIWCRNGIYSLL